MTSVGHFVKNGKGETMTKIPFEDVHAYEDRVYYASPNEEVQAWYELLKGKPIYKAAGICSSGEVGFFALLPVVRKELVLIDHSYRSLSIAMLKYLLIKERGLLEARRLLTGGDFKALQTALKELKEHLPDKVKSAYESFDVVRYNTIDPFSNSQYSYGSHKTISTNTIHRGIKQEWEKAPEKLITACAAKLDRVKFVHGDLTDLEARGPFGLLYLSNALEHRSRTGLSPLIEAVEKAVKPGGYVICAHSSGGFYGTHKTATDRWGAPLATIQAKASISWVQSIYQIPVKEKEAIAA